MCRSIIYVYYAKQIYQLSTSVTSDWTNIRRTAV